MKKYKTADYLAVITEKKGESFRLRIYAGSGEKLHDEIYTTIEECYSFMAGFGKWEEIA